MEKQPSKTETKPPEKIKAFTIEDIQEIQEETRKETMPIIKNYIESQVLERTKQFIANEFQSKVNELEETLKTARIVVAQAHEILAAPTELIEKITESNATIDKQTAILTIMSEQISKQNDVLSELTNELKVINSKFRIMTEPNKLSV